MTQPKPYETKMHRDSIRIVENLKVSLSSLFTLNNWPRYEVRFAMLRIYFKYICVYIIKLAVKKISILKEARNSISTAQDRFDD